MKGDFSRRTFDARRHYSAVLVEQGRMLTDADSEEEHRIVAHRQETGLADVIGRTGGPLDGAGFAPSTDGTQVSLGKGRYYVAGTLLENEDDDVTIETQPDRSEVTWPPDAGDGRYVIVLETWRRLITALDNPAIRDVALGGPTTSAREQVVWQVFAAKVGADWTCADPLPEPEVTTGRLAAQAEPDAAQPTPCLIPPRAGYTGLENQFYRVEILSSGSAYDLAAAPDSFALTARPGPEQNVVEVAAVGDLEVGQFVEVYAAAPDASFIPTLGQITDITGTTLQLSVDLPPFGPGDVPTLRRVDACFVASRENGSVVTTIEVISGAEVTVHDLGPDEVLGFATGDLVELTDDRIETESLPRQLRQIADIDVARRVVKLRTPAVALRTPKDLPDDGTGVVAERHPKLRRWDAAGAVRFRPDGSDWIRVEHGTRIRFVDGHYRNGDYWTFPARTATVDAASGTIAWPQDGPDPALLPPFGVARHRAVLGRFDVTGATISDLVDCRDLFPPLTGLRTLLYVGGDGQEGAPGGASLSRLPGRLEVRVANGGQPVPGAQVRFAVTAGAGRLNNSTTPVDITTDSAGLAGVVWEIDNSQEHQQVEAHLLSPAGTEIAHQVVQFHATIDRDTGGSTGCCRSVGPGGDYDTLEEALKDVRDGGILDACLCLMPGEHFFGGGDVVGPKEGVAAHLSIHGCGRGSRVLFEERWRLSGWSSVRLADFDLMGTSEQATLVLEEVTEVEITGCQVFGLKLPGALVSIQECARVTLTGSVLVARTAEAFDGLRRLFDGLEPLQRPWDLDVEVRLIETVLGTAIDLATLKPDARREVVAELRSRIADDPGDIWSRGEITAAEALADALEFHTGPSEMAAALTALDRAATMARGGIVLEIGSAPIGPEQPIAVAGRSVLLGANHLYGAVAFYGHGDPKAELHPDILARLNGMVTDSLNGRGSGSNVHVRDNLIGRVHLSVEMLRLLQSRVGNPAPLREAYGTFHLVDNVIDGAISEVVAGRSVLTGNVFTLNALPRRVTPPNNHVARVIGDGATYTANHGVQLTRATAVLIFDATRVSAQAANLELQIQ